jgi:hypothetical protein
MPAPGKETRMAASTTRTRSKPAPAAGGVAVPDPFTPDPVITVATNSRYPGITGQLIDIYADDAAELLAAAEAIRNRRTNLKHIQGIARDILDGNWFIDGAAICQNDAGLTQNGWHRLNALMEAQRTENGQAALEGRTPHRLSIPTFVIAGLPDKARRTMDTNRGLSAADWAAIQGISYAGLVTALAKLIFMYESPAGRNASGISWSARATNPEVDAVLLRHPEIHVIARKTAAWSGDPQNRDMKGCFPPAIAAFGLWLFTYNDMWTGWKFMERLWFGAVADPASPILAFRKRLQNAVHGTENVTRLDVAKWLFTAWNAEIDGKTGRDVDRAKNKTKSGDIPVVKNGPQASMPADPARWADMLDPEKLEKRLGLLPGHTEDL